MTKSIPAKIRQIRDELDEVYNIITNDSTTNPLDCMQIDSTEWPALSTLIS